MKKAILFMCSLCCVLGGTFTSYASEMQTNELVIVEEEQTAEAIAPTIFVADTSQIYTYTMMQNDIAQLTRMFPDKIQYEVVGQSTEGRDIYLLILGNPKAEHAVFVEGSIHGREYITTQLIMHMLLNYTVSYDTNEAYQEMLNNVCFYIVPMSNPDGVSISQLGEACTEDENRLNFLRTVYKADSTGYQSYANYLARWKANANGVDINRNFDAGWYTFLEHTNRSSEKYKGVAPGTEPETVALMTAFSKRDFDCVLNYHARGEVIYYGALGISSELSAKSKALAQLVNSVNHYRMIDTTTSSVCVSGGFGDWVMMVQNTPSIAIEVGRGECPVSQSEFSSIWKKNYNMWEFVSYYAKNVK